MQEHHRDDIAAPRPLFFVIGNTEKGSSSFSVVREQCLSADLPDAAMVTHHKPPMLKRLDDTSLLQ
jgi:hypothetical protein